MGSFLPVCHLSQAYIAFCMLYILFGNVWDGVCCNVCIEGHWSRCGHICMSGRSTRWRCGQKSKTWSWRLFSGQCQSVATTLPIIVYVPPCTLAVTHCESCRYLIFIIHVDVNCSLCSSRWLCDTNFNFQKDNITFASHWLSNINFFLNFLLFLISCITINLYINYHFTLTFLVFITVCESPMKSLIMFISVL